MDHSAVNSTSIPHPMPIGAVSATLMSSDGKPFNEFQGDALMDNNSSKRTFAGYNLPNVPGRGGAPTNPVNGAKVNGTRDPVETNGTPPTSTDAVQSVDMQLVPKFIRTPMVRAAKVNQVDENVKSWSKKVEEKVLNADKINDKIHSGRGIFVSELLYMLNTIASACGMCFSYNNVTPENKKLQWKMSLDFFILSSGKTIKFVDLDDNTIENTVQEMMIGMYVPKPLALLLGVIHCHRPYTSAENKDLLYIKTKFEELYRVVDGIDPDWIVDWVKEVLFDRKLRDDTLITCNRFIFDSIFHYARNKKGHLDMKYVIDGVCDKYCARTAKFIEFKNMIPDETVVESYMGGGSKLAGGFDI